MDGWMMLTLAARVESKSRFNFTLWASADAAVVVVVVGDSDI